MENFIVGLGVLIVGQMFAFVAFVVKIDRRLYRIELKVGVEK